MTDRPLLHLVFGGPVQDPRALDFTNCDDLDIVGIYPDHEQALKAWRGASQKRVDEADIKYVIVHLHRMFDPETDTTTDD